MKEPMKWSVTNGVFVGYLLCDDTSNRDLEELGVKVEAEEVWLPCCIDLRKVSLLRKRGFDDDANLTVMDTLSDEGTLTVSAPIGELTPHFIASRLNSKPEYR